MSTTKETKEIQIPFQIKNIEILDVNLAFPGQIIQDNKTFHYNIHLQHRINQENKLIFVDTSIEILHQDKKTKLGFIKASCIYFVETLLDYRSKNDGQLIDLPKVFITTLNSISISTTRGIMFSYYRGTFLHNAVLPIIDPKSYVPDKLQH
jgi:hypothetical protein